MELIALLHQSTGQKAVILIDEYDKPITDHLLTRKSQKLTARSCTGFYQVLKATDEHLRFVFLTGMSKFSKVSIFSGLNSLNNITMDDRYVVIYG